MDFATPYSEYVTWLAHKLPRSIVDITTPRKRPPMPTLATSEFLTNKQLGDWGEDLVLRSLQSSTNFVVVKYGRTSDKIAGEEGFKQFYDRYQDELDNFGKRPDLLVFRSEDYLDTNRDLTETEDEEVTELVQRAILGIEVRASNYLSRKYIPGKSSRFDVLSFTIKVEDLITVLKWIQTTGVPYMYVQVTFDEVYAIEFHRALEIISNPARKGRTYTIARDPKNQFKTTIKIPFNQGTKIGEISGDLSLNAVGKELLGGRLLFYVQFSGGSLQAIEGIWDRIFRDAERLKYNPPVRRT